MSDTLTHPAEGASVDEGALAKQDAALRHWTHDTPGPIRIGSDEHRKMFCRMLLDTHDPYRPAVLDWPKLVPDALRRLTALPIWDIAVQTEGRASIRVKTYAATVADPLLRAAIDMDGDEEARHILFFVNWVAWYRNNLPWWRRPWHALRVAGIWIKLVWDRMAIARGIDADGVAHDSNFLPANREVLGDSLKPRDMIELCLREDEARMRGYDSRLLRPTLVPALARIALRFMKQ